ncbi:MAG: hypothetical protein WAL81_07850 [Methanobacterium sp.]
MDQFELFLILEKAKTVPLEPAEIQELSYKAEIQLTMDQMGIINKPIGDINETVTQIIKELNNNELVNLNRLFRKD